MPTVFMSRYVVDFIAVISFMKRLSGETTKPTCFVIRPNTIMRLLKDHIANLTYSVKNPNTQKPGWKSVSWI